MKWRDVVECQGETGGAAVAHFGPFEGRRIADTPHALSLLQAYHGVGGGPTEHYILCYGGAITSITQPNYRTEVGSSETEAVGARTLTQVPVARIPCTPG